MHGGVEIEGFEQKLLNPRFVLAQLFADSGGLIAGMVEQAIQAGPVEKCEVDCLVPNFLRQRLEIGLFVLEGIAHVIRDVLLFQIIEDIGTAVHATGFERIFLLRKIEQGDVLEWDVVEVKITAELQLSFDKTRKQAPEEAAAGASRRQPAQMPQEAKGGVRRIINEITPVPVLARIASRKDGRNTGRAVTENRRQALPQGCDRFEERIVLDDFPSAGVDKNEQRQNWFHSGFVPTALTDSEWQGRDAEWGELLPLIWGCGDLDGRGEWLGLPQADHCCELLLPGAPLLWELLEEFVIAELPRELVWEPEPSMLPEAEPLAPVLVLV